MHLHKILILKFFALYFVSILNEKISSITVKGINLNQISFLFHVNVAMFETVAYHLWINFLYFNDFVKKIISLLCIYFCSIIKSCQYLFLKVFERTLGIFGKFLNQFLFKWQENKSN